MCATLIKNNVKPIVIYVHGLGSGTASTTIRTVRKVFSEYEWIAIEVNENPFESRQFASMQHYCIHIGK